MFLVHSSASEERSNFIFSEIFKITEQFYLGFFRSFSVILFCLILFSVNSYSQNIEIKGHVKDEQNVGLQHVNIFTIDEKYSTSSDTLGYFQLTLPAEYLKLYFKQYDSEPVIIDIPKVEYTVTLNVILSGSEEIDVVVIEADRINATGIISVDPLISDLIPSITEDIESIIKTEAGVTGSRNELSSKYSVRGGSFDENLVYVNEIEIYRPQLIRSGQQEGLSFINPKLVSDIKFSSGGFEAKYGGKLSSVLDVRYKKVKNNELTTSLSFLGGSFHFQNLSKNRKFSHVSGIRYKTTRYLLNTLETTGSYDPDFLDFQTFISYSFNTEFDISFFANISDNNFQFYPESGRTNFGSIQNLYSLGVSFFGQERDRFFSNTEAISLNFHPNKNLNLSLIFSSLYARESETFDIIGIYSLNELNKDIGSGTAGDSLLNIGTGSYMSHARNYLNIIGASCKHSGFFNAEKHFLNWGISYIYINIQDKIDEWNLKDSASYSIPLDDDLLIISENIKAKNSLTNHKIIAYLQDKVILNSYNFQYEIITGVRAHYNTLAGEFLLSPRFAAAARSFGKNRHTFRFSSGIYHQPIFYKEIRNFDGNLATDKSAQKSIHFVFGHNFKYKAIGRNMRLFTEIYYKHLYNIIPFEMDNVRVRYYADVRISGYAAGIDLKLIGDFVPGIDSWVSLSLLKTEEKINDTEDTEADDTYISRPTDQRVTANLFVQDYVPGNKNFKVHLNFVYGTSFPFGYPKDIINKASFRSFPYHRVDLGASVVLIKEGKTYNSKFLNFFKSLWLTVEIFNMLDIQNTISYRWVHVVPNTSIAANAVNNTFPVPNKLTGRRFNLKLSIKI